MLKIVCAAAIAMASFATPAFADNHDKVVAAPPAGTVKAPVGAIGALPSSGLSGAVIVGGIAAVGVLGVVAFAASDGDDDGETVVSTTGTGGAS